LRRDDKRRQADLGLVGRFLRCCATVIGQIFDILGRYAPREHAEGLRRVEERETRLRVTSASEVAW
jgi:hypothetical protein